MFAELDIKVGIQNHAHDFRDEFVRPRGDTKWTLLPVLFGNPDSSGRFPVIPLMAKGFDNGIDFLQAHSIHGFIADTARHCAVVAVNAPICFQVQLSIEELSIHALDRQPAFASFTENSSVGVGVLHCAHTSS